MAKIDPNTIKEIAQHIDCGYNSYFNFNTGEILNIPCFDYSMDEEYFQEVFGADIERSKSPDFICIEPLESKTSFEIMERFAHNLPEGTVKLRVYDALSNKKPFRNFKHIIDNSPFRQNWFDFKQEQIEIIVAKQLE